MRTASEFRNEVAGRVAIMDIHRRFGPGEGYEAVQEGGDCGSDNSRSVAGARRRLYAADQIDCCSGREMWWRVSLNAGHTVFVRSGALTNTKSLVGDP